MKKIMIGLLLLSVLLFGCKQSITNFDECAAAGNPVMESYPRQCSDGVNTFVEQIHLTEEMARAIAQASECIMNGTLTENASYNNYTKTWWIDLDIEKEGCSPACVVYEENNTAVINWRCTGLIVQNG